MKQLKLDLLTNKYTDVYHENDEDIKFGAPHNFTVIQSIPKNEKYFGNTEYVEPKTLAEIHFQEGSIKEYGVNGVNNEDLIAMIICRLQHFQNTDFSCRENAIAITKLEETLLWLRKRTMGREQRGVEGTHEL